MTAAQWLEVALSYSLQVFLVVLVGCWLERRMRNSSDRCFVWNACFAVILFLGLWSILMPRFRIVQPWSYLDPHDLLQIGRVQGAIGRVLMFVWGIGAVIALVRWIMRAIWLRTTLSRCQQIEPKRVCELVEGFGHNLPSQQTPAIYISNDNYGPCCWQLHRPTILLPAFILEGSVADLRHVLAHELEHLRTNHPFHLFLQQLAEVVCWFHPAIWKAVSRASLAREYACDDAAVNEGQTTAAYLRTLLRIAERQCNGSHIAQSVGFSYSKSEIVARAQRLANCSNDSHIERAHGPVGATSIVVAVGIMALIVSQIWIPSDVMSSTRSKWSPWPTWTAKVGHLVGLHLRDYEQFDRRVQPYELMHDEGPH
jgi:beta-lactamase regulating signal transducer with metallopeptidase domain